MYKKYTSKWDNIITDQSASVFLQIYSRNRMSGNHFREIKQIHERSKIKIGSIQIAS